MEPVSWSCSGGVRLAEDGLGAPGRQVDVGRDPDPVTAPSPREGLALAPNLGRGAAG
jgi:hypothetical protein